MTNPKDLKLIALVAPPASSALSPRVRTVLGDTGYRANLDAFAAQMEGFRRMRETEHAFRRALKQAGLDRYDLRSIRRLRRFVVRAGCAIADDFHSFVEPGSRRRRSTARRVSPGDSSQPLYTRHGRRYRAAANTEILDAAASITVAQTRGATLSSPQEAGKLCRSLCAGYDNERFGCRMARCTPPGDPAETLFTGTIDGAAVYPRVVAKRALELNAAAVILTHNHPSGVAEPSEADRTITLNLSKALALVEIRLLDHLVVTGDSCVSLAERGWL